MNEAGLGWLPRHTAEAVAAGFYHWDQQGICRGLMRDRDLRRPGQHFGGHPAEVAGLGGRKPQEGEWLRALGSLAPPWDSHTVCWLAARQLILVKVFSALLARTDPFGLMKSSLGFSLPSLGSYLVRSQNLYFSGQGQTEGWCRASVYLQEDRCLKQNQILGAQLGAWGLLWLPAPSPAPAVAAEQHCPGSGDRSLAGAPALPMPPLPILYWET